MQSPALPVLLLVHLLVYGGALLLLAPGAGLWALVFCALLIWVSVTDIRRFEIPDTASALLVATGLLRLAAMPEAAWIPALAGGLFWPLAFWLVARAYRRSRNRQGLGLGDVKLMAGLGLWCGLTGGVWIVLGASLAAIAALLAATWARHKSIAEAPGEAVAFGPFLCLSAWCVWLTGPWT